MMLMKSRHNNTKQYLTSHARRAFILCALVVMAGGAWGQIAYISTGAIDNQSKVAKYNQLYVDYPVDASTSIPAYNSDAWTRDATNPMRANKGQHWDGTSTSTYFEMASVQWGYNSWENNQSTTVHLPKGQYVLIGAGRSSYNVNAYFSVNGTQVRVFPGTDYDHDGDTGWGITTDGTPSFESGTYANVEPNDNQGRGWQYRYIKFEVTADGGADVPIQIGGGTFDDSRNHQWMSFCQPTLLKTASATEKNLTEAMFMQWNGTDGSAINNCAYEFGVASETAYGDAGVVSTRYADLSDYQSLTLEMTENTPRVFFNSLSDTERITIDNNSEYVTVEGNKWTINIAKIVGDNGYAHLNAIKGPSFGQTVTISSAKLTGQSFTGMYHEWDGTGANANITVQHPANFVWHVNEEVAAGQVIYGESGGGVPSNQYADLSQYDQLIVTYDNTKALPRFLFNKDGVDVNVEGEGDYMTIEGNQITIHLAKLASDNGGYAHLNCIKSPWGSSSIINSVTLKNVEKPVTISKTIAVGSDNTIELDGELMCDHIPYNYIRIELVNGTNNKELYPEGAQNIPEGAATFKVGSMWGDKQGDYADVNGNHTVYANASLGETYDGILVSSGTFTFKLPNRFNYAGNHLKIYLSRFKDNSYGVSNPPEDEKIYDYTLWIAGDEANATEHYEYDSNNHSSNFTVNLYELTNNGAKILNHFDEKSKFAEFDNFYLRWYVADKVTHQPIVDANGSPISLNNLLSGTTTYSLQMYKEPVGMLWYLKNGWDNLVTSEELRVHAEEVLSVNVNLSSVGLTQDDVEIVALITDDYTNSAVGAEPSNIKHKYIVGFMEGGEHEYTNLPFRHYKGVTGRDWVTPNGSTGTMTQEIWTVASDYDNLQPTTSSNDPEKRVTETGNKTPLNVSTMTGNIRQGVHTWEYDVYITPDDNNDNDGNGRALELPFENYMRGYKTGITGDGNDLEPRAYFRWYDWNTDKAVVAEESAFTFTACNPNILKHYMETVNSETRDRGLVAINLDPEHPTQGRIGVWIKVASNFATKYPNGIDIACDVSRYSDGIRLFGSNAYLEHEPTLSTRYIFHVYPGKKIADELAAAKTNLNKCRAKLEDMSLTDEARLELYNKLEYYGIPTENINPMFDLPENIGRVVVSLGAGKTGEFSLRFDEHLLENYKLYDNSNNIVTADRVKWVAFYKDEQDGHVMRKELMEGTSRIQTFTYNDFLGSYYHLGSSTADETVTDGMRFHVIGYATQGANVNTISPTSSDVYAPVVHYELQFLVAPAVSVADLKNNASVRAANITRTDEYMAQHYDLQSVVDFDGNPQTNKNLLPQAQPQRKHNFYSTSNWYDQPTTRLNNMSWLPREWSDIEYSYCYPQLTDYVIDTGWTMSWYDYNHLLSPFHGDYMILKSMNVPGISNDRQDPKLVWWWNTQLYDYTHVYTNNSQYGSYLYTDASNESRTMITIPFTADLCKGSSIYVTTAVADMTDSQTKPQLLIRVVGVDGQGNHKNVVSFHTCDISTTGGRAGEWYQVYGESSVPLSFDDDIQNFICEVVNYANNTNGADFAIDQFQVYTSTAKIKISQDQGDCDDPETNKMFIYAEAEGLQALYGRSGNADIYWRIHDENGEVVTAVKMYDNYDTEGTVIYGKTTVPLDYTNHMYYNTNIVDEATVKANDNLHWFMGEDHKVYCKIAYRYLPGLLDGHTYYVSIYGPEWQNNPQYGFRPEATSFWGGLHTAATSKCSVFSPDFIPRQQFVIYVNDGTGNAEGGTILTTCHGAPEVNDMTMRLKKPDLTQASGFTNIDDLHYDYFFGTMAQWASNDKFDANYTYAQLRSAIEDYRLPLAYPNDVGLNSSYSNVVDGVDYKDVLQAAIDAKLLKLSCSQTFTNNFNDWSSPNYTVLALAVEKTVGSTAICSPFMVKFDIQTPSPEMELGFADVTYPKREGFHRIVRIGLEQLYNLRKNGYMLHVPIHDYKNKTKQENTGTLYFSDAILKISKVSDDPTGPAVNTSFAKLVSPNSNSSHGEIPFVDADHMFLALDLSGDNCQINFHEGYSYEVSTSFYDNTEALTNACTEDIYLTIKVVPEFVTWNPQELGSQTDNGIDYYNVNWNNDINWNRSERAELYMDGADTHQQNTPTAWRNDVEEGGSYYYGDKYYKNDTEINPNLSSDHAFVPMKFTYVTLPSDRRAPSLINMDLVAYNNSPYTGGAILAGNLLTDPSPADPTRTVNSPATADIRYDMLVRYSENTCQGHLQKDGSIFGQGTASVYDCEKFYGNICKEIYFKPRAELINQQRMTYEKAWVEKELEPNKWYLMSAPLKATYSGDMYVPFSNGLQDTEAFQPINFTDTKGSTALYSRTKYPFYQHSWDHGTGANGSVVYTETTDSRQPYYDADLNYAGAVTSTFAQWSHVFNDVQVSYSQMQGFAIRAHKRSGAADDRALLRLPKADTDWDYYDYKSEKGTLNQGVTKGNLNYGRFVTEDSEGKPFDNKANMSVSLVQPNENSDNQYFLVGNPYMASLDMEKFFAANTHLGTAWWTIDGNPATGLNSGRVKPMEAFFVKTTSPGTQVKFANDMMVDGNDGTDQSAHSRPYIKLRASKGNVTSTALLEFSDQASADYISGEDVETLFDSNLSDVPMVYTVAADGQAVSINKLPALEVVPFGVTCSGDEMIDVTVDHSVYVFDALLGTTTAVNEGESVSIQPNDYGRYYLTVSEDASGLLTNKAVAGITISVRDCVVTVTSNDDINQVKAVNVSGVTAYESTVGSKTTQFTLPTGTYIIDVNGVAGSKTVKILVK